MNQQPSLVVNVPKIVVETTELAIPIHMYIRIIMCTCPCMWVRWLLCNAPPALPPPPPTHPDRVGERGAGWERLGQARPQGKSRELAHLTLAKRLTGALHVALTKVFLQL
jgi:hypothetical protein